MLSSYLKKHEVPIIYLNQVGGQDELVFDGSSMVFLETKKFLNLKVLKLTQRKLRLLRVKN